MCDTEYAHDCPDVVKRFTPIVVNAREDKEENPHQQPTGYFMATSTAKPGETFSFVYIPASTLLLAEKVLIT